MRLTYELAANDTQMRRVLRGVEAEARASNRRIGRDSAGVVFGPGRKEAQDSARYREKVARDVARAQESLDRQRSRALLASIKSEEREKLRADKATARAAETLDKQRARAGEMLDKQRSRALLQQFREAEREQRRADAARARGVANVRGGVARSVMGGINSARSLGGTALGIAGGFAAAGAIHASMQEQAKATELANQAGDPSLKGKLLNEARNVRGFTGGEALGGLAAFVTKTGDLDTARKISGSQSTLALATGSEFADLMATAGQVFNVLKDSIADPEERIKQLNMVMGTLAQQGSMGAVEIKDLATEFGKLGAASRAFEGDGSKLLRSMGAFAQIAVEKGGAASSADAATATARLAGDIVTNKKKFTALGIDVQSKTDVTKLRAPEEILFDVLAKTKGDVTKTSGLLGLESQKIFKGLAATFSEAERREPGSGGTAVREYFKRYAGAESSEQDLERKAASRLEDPDIKIKEATKVFNEAVGNHLAPVIADAATEFARLAPQIAGITKAIARFAGFLLENPFTGVGVIVGSKIGKSIMDAGIGNMISGEIKGKLGAALNGLGAGLSVATLIVTANILNFEKREAQMDAGGKDVLEAQALAATGDVKGVETILGRRRDAVDEAKDEGWFAKALEPLLYIGRAFGAAGTGMAAEDVLSDKNVSPTASAISDTLLDQNRQVAVKSLEGFAASVEAAREAALKFSASVKPNGGGTDPSRTSPIGSAARP